MRAFHLIAAVTAIALPLPSVAQTATEAFECKLPYRPTMEAAAKLKVIEEGKPMDMIISTMTVVQLEPGTMRVFGLAPDRVTLLLSEPTAQDKPISMNFQAHFKRSPAIEEALRSVVKWKDPCAAWAAICHRQDDPTDSGKLMLRLDNTDIWLKCEFEIARDGP
jgi:hypothetical protein